jgi:hypothetical protein
VDDARNPDDAAAGRRDVHSEAGTDGGLEDAAPEASSDSDAAASSDVTDDRGEAAPDGSMEDAGHPHDDGTNDALDVPVDDGP